MWALINIIILAIGLGNLYTGWKTDRSENYDALMHYIVGFILVMVSVISFAIKYFFGG